MRQLEASHDNVIGYSLTGTASAEDYEIITSRLRDAITEHGKIRVLFRLSDISISSFFKGLDERFNFAKEHADDVERVAVVTDDTAVDVLSNLTNAASPIEVRTFKADDEQQAWAWLE